MASEAVEATHRQQARQVETQLEEEGRATGTWIEWLGSSRFHHSREFDGEAHTLACSRVVTVSDNPLNVTWAADELPEQAQVCQNCLAADWREIRDGDGGE